MVTFCDILHEAKQETKINSRECARSTDWKINFKLAGNQTIGFTLAMKLHPNKK